MFIIFRNFFLLNGNLNKMFFFIDLENIYGNWGIKVIFLWYVMVFLWMGSFFKIVDNIEDFLFFMGLVIVNNLLVCILSVILYKVKVLLE